MQRIETPQPPQRLAAHFGIFTFPSDDAVYADHFPGAAVVPGTLIIHAFVQEAVLQGWGTQAIRTFRFRNFAKPGSYAFSMTFTEGGVRCALRSGGHDIATGELCCLPQQGLKHADT